MSLPLAWIVMVPLLTTLFGIAIAAWYYRRRYPIKHAPNRALIFRCGRCQKVYLDQRRVPLSRCPVCSLLNEPIKR